MEEKVITILKKLEATQKAIVGSRNSISILEHEGKKINVKAFKIPGFITGIIYKFFRKSKARRSYEHALFLEKNNIGTPQPIGYYENSNFYKLLDTYYISEHLEADFVFNHLFNTDVADLDIILKGFARFSFQMHECGIEFLDHSPGNTLIKKIDDNYHFYLVDLNRMRFHKDMSLDQRMKNLERIAPSNHFRRVISEEYARLYGKSFEEVYGLMNHYSERFFKKFDRKIKLKKTIKLK